MAPSPLRMRHPRARRKNWEKRAEGYIINQDKKGVLEFYRHLPHDYH